MSIAGGKYTTYRVMAADAVDACNDYIPTRVAPLHHRASAAARCRRLLRPGQPVRTSRPAIQPAPVPDRRLLNRYGSSSTMCSSTPTTIRRCSNRSVAPQYLRVEVVYAVRNEAALHLEDVLARRTRISIEYAHRGVDCAQEVADLMAPALGWSAEDIAYEVDTYRAPGGSRDRLPARTRRRVGRRPACLGTGVAGPGLEPVPVPE